MHFYRLLYNGFAILSFLPVLAIAALTNSTMLYSGALTMGRLDGSWGDPGRWQAWQLAFSQTDVWEFIGLRQVREKRNAPAQLKTDGLYRYVRHPLYATGLVIHLAVPAYDIGNILVFNLSLTIYILIGAFFEERKLRREFGQAYIDYAAVTPMLIPFVKKKRT